DPRQDRDEPDQPGDDRAEDERQQPSQEEDEDDVAEGEEDAGREAHPDHRQDDRAEDEHRRQPALLPIAQVQHRRASPRRAGPPREGGAAPLPFAVMVDAGPSPPLYGQLPHSLSGPTADPSAPGPRPSSPWRSGRGGRPPS